MKPQTLGILITLTAMLPLAAQAAPPKAKVTPQQARAAAVKKMPGKATAAKYELEDGHWQYAVTVVSKKGGIYEVEVNSTTGQVTDTEKTTPAEEAKEAAADKKSAMQHGLEQDLKLRRQIHPAPVRGKDESGEED